MGLVCILDFCPSIFLGLLAFSGGFLVVVWSAFAPAYFSLLFGCPVASGPSPGDSLFLIGFCFFVAVADCSSVHLFFFSLIFLFSVVVVAVSEFEVSPRSVACG